MQKQDLPFKKYVFVCVNQRDEGACCGPAGGREIRDWLKQMVKDRGLQGVVRVSQSGCMDQCIKGPNVMIFPDNVWYHGVELNDTPKVFEGILAGLPEGRDVSKH